MASSASGTVAGASAITVVLPFYNEERFIGRTLESLAAQTARPGRLVLVDNASSDASARLVEDFLRQSGIEGRLVSEPRPGKINALETGAALVTSPFVAFCDADTYYPPHYFETAAALFERRPDCAGVTATNVSGVVPTSDDRLFVAKQTLMTSLLAKQCHAGGYGQIFRTDIFRAAGGYSAARWPFVLEDHEIAHRIFKFGPFVTSRLMWCAPSDRRQDRANVDWTLAERILYHATPFALKDWFFYDFLSKRFDARGLRNVNLRDRALFAPHISAGSPPGASPAVAE
ncbi:MAG: glycosyltransferase family 2 protein [Parvularculaceae bacterium]|nr:glycosyltransferase family 2 protein [Parvularculaceae bacterium]